MTENLIEDAAAIVQELRHLRGHKLLSTDWQPVIAAEDMLLELAGRLQVEIAEKELPDAEGYWWADEGYGDPEWLIFFVVKIEGKFGTRFVEEDVTDELDVVHIPLRPGRWVRCLPPGGKGGD